MPHAPCSPAGTSLTPKSPRKTFWGGSLAAATALTLLVPALPAQATAPGAPATVAAPAADAQPQAMTQERIDAANNAISDQAATLEFITMSDTELGGSATAEKTSEQVAYEGALPHFTKLRAWADAQGFDPSMIVNNGDVVGANDPEYSDHMKGNSEKVAGWYLAVERVMRESFPDAQVMLTQGNHDIADLMGKTIEQARTDRAPAGAPQWFYPNASTGYQSNFHTTVNGIDFIGLDYNGKETFGYAGQRTGYQAFLTQTLKDIAAAPGYDPAKPIFVSIHSGYAGTSLGGPFHGDYDMAGPDLQRILADYPQAVLGSAHTHFSANPETSIFQKDFTVYENASMNYIYQDVPSDFLGGGYFSGNQGDAENGVPQKSANFISVMEDGSTVIRRFDVTHERWMGMPWVVNAATGKAGFTYTSDKRSTTAPWWQAAQVSARNTTETGLTLEFDQAQDDELVNYYEIQITDAAGSPVPFTANQVPDFGGNAAKSFTGSFKAYSRFFMTPNSMGFDIAGLKPATTYTVNVVAVDDFQNKSEALTGTVRTAGTLVFPELPEAPVPIAAEEFLNLPFEGNLDDLGAAAATAPEYSAIGDVSYAASDRTGAAGQVARIGAGNKNYVDLGSRPEFDLGTDADLTMSFWTKVTSVNGYGAIISNKNWANWYRSGLNLAPQGGDTSKLEFTVGDGTNGIYATGDVANYRDTWHMMTVTIDRERNMASTYMDGALAKETSIAEVGSLTSELNMLIGVDGSKSYGAGLDIDDLKMWDSALTPAEVAGLFATDDTTAERDALGQAVAYTTELVQTNAAEAANGRVFEQPLSDTMQAALTESSTLLGTAAPTEAALRTSFTALRDAVTAVEAQTVRFSYAAEAHNGTVTPESGVADKDGQLRLTLAPAPGFQLAGAQIEVTGVESSAVEGSELVLQGVHGKVLAAVTFVAADGDGGTEPGGPGDGGTNPGDGGTNPGDGGTNPGDGGTNTGGGDSGAGTTPGQGGTGTGTGAGSDAASALAATGGETTWAGALVAAVLMAAAGAALWVRTRLRRQ